jgi:hypothetical protein
MVSVNPKPFNDKMLPVEDIVASLLANAAVNGRGERMRASGPLDREVRLASGVLPDAHLST